MSNEQGNSSTGIVAIFALVLVAGASYFFWIRPANSTEENNTTIIEKEKVIEKDSDKKKDEPLIDIDIFSDDDDKGEK